MPIVTIIFTTLTTIFGFLLWNHSAENRKLTKQLSEQKNINLELLKRIPVSPDQEESRQEPLNVEKIADAVRKEGYVPEIDEKWVVFKAQGEGYYIDASRLPLLFIVKSYSMDPTDWEMSLLREAAHRMSDELVMVKATISDDEKDMRFFIAAQDRNYESFRSNLTAYLSILEEGRSRMWDIYNHLIEEKREEAKTVNPIIPSAKTENKMLS